MLKPGLDSSACPPRVASVMNVVSGIYVSSETPYTSFHNDLWLSSTHQGPSRHLSSATELVV